MDIHEQPFGKTAHGKQVHLFTLSNGRGVKASLTDFGAALCTLEVPDRKGQPRDIVLGFDSLGQYMQDRFFIGGTIGRFANRIGKARFSLDGKEYRLAANDGPNHLHGGVKAFHKVLWASETVSQAEGSGIRFKYLSKDGEEGYPGNLSVEVTYLFTRDGEMVLLYEAVTDKPTPVNLTNHSYFNLSGNPGRPILNHLLHIPSVRIIDVDDELIPTGDIISVEGTAKDFSNPAPIGYRIGELASGYDLCYVLEKNGGVLGLAARIWEPETGIQMEIWTTEPGIQFYSGHFLDGTETGKWNRAYQKYAGLCLETQHFADSPNQKKFPSTLLEPGKKYTQKTIYQFGLAG